ncbi:MAG: hypothetical protein AAGG57_15820 [Pseudomonadota bacterium]
MSIANSDPNDAPNQHPVGVYERLAQLHPEKPGMIRSVDPPANDTSRESAND